MITHKFIDYLQYNCLPNQVPYDDNQKLIKGVANYRHGLELPDKTRVYFGHWNTDRPLVVMSGQAMNNIRVWTNEQNYMEHIIDKGAKITRLDMAMDIYVSDTFIRTDDFMAWFWENKIISSHVINGEGKRNPKVIAEVNHEGFSFQTVNFGDLKNRAKKGMVRVYDKGIELNLEEFMITRIEVEDKREKAHISAKRILECGDVAPVLKSRFDVNDDLFQQAIQAENIDMTRGQNIERKNESDALVKKWQWLIETVAPTLGKTIAMDIDLGANNLDLFNKAVELGYSEHLNEAT